MRCIYYRASKRCNPCLRGPALWSTENSNQREDARGQRRLPWWRERSCVRCRLLPSEFLGVVERDRKLQFLPSSGRSCSVSPRVVCVTSESWLRRYAIWTRWLERTLLKRVFKPVLDYSGSTCSTTSLIRRSVQRHWRKSTW